MTQWLGVLQTLTNTHEIMSQFALTLMGGRGEVCSANKDRKKAIFNSIKKCLRKKKSNKVILNLKLLKTLNNRESCAFK